MLSFATVGKPHGVRGALRLTCSAEHHELLLGLPAVSVADPDSGEVLETRVAAVAGMPGAPIVELEGVEDRDAAERLRGREMSAAREDFPPPGEDEFYVADLEGCIVHALDGQRIGVVERADVLPANTVLTVRLDSGGPELLVPFIRDAVPELDVEGRSLTIDVGFLGG